MFSDTDSAVIRRFGILNTLIAEDDHPWFGVPFPGTYIIDGNGIVTQKFFEHSFSLRPDAAQLIQAANGHQLEVAAPTQPLEEVAVEVKIESEGLAPFITAGVVVTFWVPQGQHLYGDPVPNGLVATKVEIDSDPGLIVKEALAPPTRSHTLSITGEVLAIYEGSFKIVVPVAHKGNSTVVLEDGRRMVEISGSVRWQSCDDHTCGLPQTQRFTLRVPQLDTIEQDLFGSREGIPEMNAAKHFEKMGSRRQENKKEKE